MKDNNKRTDGRSYNDIRPIKITFDALGYADSSVFFELGETKVLVSITLQQQVPQFLKGQRVGWLSAEYSMLPCATQQRTTRESSQVQKNSRGVEISRLIGRALRATVNLEKLGERSIIIDCDVLQADGGTRVACITAASLALECAIHRWVEAGILEENIFKEHIAAISVGIVNGISHVDLSYIEDSQADADFNIVITKSEKLIEIQGTSERTPVSWEQFEIIKNLALDSLRKIFDLCLLESKKNLEKREKKLLYSIQQNTSSMGPINKTPFFSLSNRISK